MRFEKRGPGCLPLSVGRRLDAIRLEDVADGGVGDVVADIGQGALDAVMGARHLPHPDRKPAYAHTGSQLKSACFS